MDFNDTPEDSLWRGQVRNFLSENLGEERLASLSDELGMGGWEHDSEWRTKVAKKGWVAPSWPVEYGGTGWSEGR